MNEKKKVSIAETYDHKISDILTTLPARLRLLNEQKKKKLKADESNTAIYKTKIREVKKKNIYEKCDDIAFENTVHCIMLRVVVKEITS